MTRPTPADAGAAPAKKDLKTGSFQLKIESRSASSSAPGILRRMGWGTLEEVKRTGAEQDYDLADESFEVHVPPDYDGDAPYGLFVWVSAGDSGAPKGEWLDVLKRRKLIWVGADRSGNTRAGWARLGLAIDAARHMRSAYNVEGGRVYVSGGSGGGRVSSMLGVGYPDVFAGGFYMIGCNYFRLVELSPGKFYRRGYNRPAPQLFTRAAKEGRHVFLTGDDDANREQTKAYFEAAKKDGFRYITYLQVPGMGHDLPDAEWFEKGIVALDDPPGGLAAKPGPKSKSGPKAGPAARAPAGKAAAAPGKAAPGGGNAQAAAALKAARALAAADPAGAYQSFVRITRKFPDTSEAAEARTRADKLAADPAVVKVIEAEQEAEKLLRLARMYAENRLYDKARDKIKALLTDYPDSPHAEEGRKLQKEIGKD